MAEKVLLDSQTEATAQLLQILAQLGLTIILF
nr:MAG TPA: hypothetical protein [Caudoviricetes sp.]